MNTMQKITVVVVVFWEAVLLMLATFASASAASAGFGTGDWLGVVVVAVTSGFVGAILVAVFARGTVIARLQRGAIVLALAGAVLALATPIVPNRYVPGWQRRLDMDAADGVIGERLLADEPDLWHDYGDYIVVCAIKHAVPVETVVAVMKCKTAVLRQSPAGPVSDDATVAELGRRLDWEAAQSQGIIDCNVGHFSVWVHPRDTCGTSYMMVPSRVPVLFRRLDSLVTDVGWDARDTRQRSALRAFPTNVRVPNWPGRLALAASVLLAGFAIVIALGLLRRKPKKTGEPHDAA
jgi:hypothetical protein